ncbi:hypothetical protein Bca52824_022861 [Brassica carinata]|uniref:Uncharacterized protein n=1 Tax=Brassica carinata TaxID=52824 RepID=A0A8X8ARW2_BRACI|nr:hypothetical protein Bca52824_022861 [Brassica carinata]
MDGVGGSDDVAPSDDETGNVKLAFEPEGNAHLWLGLATEIDESDLLLLFPSEGDGGLGRFAARHQKRKQPLHLPEK